MALNESSGVDATLLAIEEINQSGGVLGRHIAPVVVDGRSDWPTFAREAERLITQEQVSVIFGCWTSASRKMVKPVVEHYNHLLFYPVPYEGLEQSPNIIYNGSAPNQHIIPAVKWSFDHLGRRFFLVGSDYVWPRTANAIIQYQVAALGGQIVGEEYILLGSTQVHDVIEKISVAQPDVILNTIVGDSNLPFARALRAAGISPDMIPTLWFTLTEVDLRSLDAQVMAGDYAAWSYFQSVSTSKNREFVHRFQAKYGQHRVTDDPTVAGYFGVYLWAQAVTDAGSPDPQRVRKAVANQSFAAPGGPVYIDAETQHTWKFVRVGQIRADGQFKIVWSSEKPVRPVPYPVYRTKSEWQAFLENLYTTWGGSWANPGP